jgi:outer membrane biosynthesis protein TonB
VPKNEDGEFELILANRQLLSVFFIVVVLLGVFFTMGYIVGRNSGPAQVDVASSRKPDTKPMVVESPAPQETPSASSAPPAAAPTSTQSQQPSDESKAEAKVEPRKEEPKPEPKKPEPKKKDEPKPKEQPAPKASAAPQSGQTYLQLAATAKTEADVMVDVLHQKKFKALAVEIPEKPGLFRVLVGPLGDGTLNKTKSDLTSSGFPGDKAIKKVY